MDVDAFLVHIAGKVTELLETDRPSGCRRWLVTAGTGIDIVDVEEGDPPVHEVLASLVDAGEDGAA
ncbi:MAG: hypothetical protein LC808_36220, partial [Actinobacteria bacterium]|nr:hypothetical protein [Actinomycetota bacterium]